MIGLSTTISIYSTGTQQKRSKLMRIFYSLLVLILVTSSALAENSTVLVERVLTQEEQAALTPDQVLTALKQGNQRFLSGTVTSRDHSAQVRSAALGQFPKAIVLSCVDSRIPVEDVFDRGIGDIFVARVAGNFENTDILGSMEFATFVSGARLVVVMGHSDCGAVKAAIDGAELGNITAMLENIKPAIDSLADYKGDKTSANPDFVRKVTIRNIEISIEDIRKRSPVIDNLEREGKVKIVGALYDMKTGAITFLDLD
jgi:carbonic anhydrase